MLRQSHVAHQRLAHRSFRLVPCCRFLFICSLRGLGCTPRQPPRLRELPDKRGRVRFVVEHLVFVARFAHQPSHILLHARSIVLKEIKQLETEVHLGRIKIVGLRLLCSSLGFVEAVEVLVRADESHISGPTAGIEFQDFSGRGKAFVIVAQIDVDDAQIMGRYRSYGIVHTPADSQIAVTLPNIFRQVRVSLAEFRCAGVLPLPVAIQENVPLFLPGS